jgi:hypothetical protein
VVAPLWYRHLVCLRPVSTAKLAGAIENDPALRVKIARWTRTLRLWCDSNRGTYSILDTHRYFTDRYASTIFAAATNLRGLEAFMSAPSSQLIASMSASVAGSLTHLNIALLSYEPASFSSLGPLVCLRELRVECMAWARKTPPAREALDLMQPWAFQNLELLDWYIADVPPQHQAAYLSFLARHHFPSLRHLRMTLCGDEDGPRPDVEPIQRFLRRHPLLRSVLLRGPAVEPSAIDAIMPLINPERLDLAGPTSDPGWVKLLSPQVRELVLAVDPSEDPPTSVLEALEEEAHRLGLRQIGLVWYDRDEDGVFEWSALRDSGDDETMEWVDVYAAWAVRLKKLGITVLDQSGKTTDMEPVKVRLRAS